MTLNNLNNISIELNITQQILKQTINKLNTIENNIHFIFLFFIILIFIICIQCVKKIYHTV